MSRGTEGRRPGSGLASLGHEPLKAPGMGMWELRTRVGCVWRGQCGVAAGRTSRGCLDAGSAQ